MHSVAAVIMGEALRFLAGVSLLAPSAAYASHYAAIVSRLLGPVLGPAGRWFAANRHSRTEYAARGTATSSVATAATSTWCAAAGRSAGAAIAGAASGAATAWTATTTVATSATTKTKDAAAAAALRR